MVLNPFKFVKCFDEVVSFWERVNREQCRNKTILKTIRKNSNYPLDHHEIFDVRIYYIEHIVRMKIYDILSVKLQVIRSILTFN